jgi:hypothetical protein
MKPNKEYCVNQILSELDWGVCHTETFAKFGTLWGISGPTFDAYWKEANRRFNLSTEEIKKAKMAFAIKEEKKAVKKAILSKYKRMELLSKIATGEIKAWREVITDGGIQKIEYYSGAEVKAAIAELNKMDGEYAPIRKDITSLGEKLAAPKFEIVIDNGES